MEQAKQNYDAVDLAKFICCLFIVGIHTSAFSELCVGGGEVLLPTKLCL